MNDNILNFQTLTDKNTELYVYVGGSGILSRGIIMGTVGTDNLAYQDSITLMIACLTQPQTFFTMLTFDVETLDDNNTDYLLVNYNNKQPTFITTSKATLAQFIRKQSLNSRFIWTKTVKTAQDVMLRKHIAGELYQTYMEKIKQL